MKTSRPFEISNPRCSSEIFIARFAKTVTKVKQKANRYLVLLLRANIAELTSPTQSLDAVNHLTCFAAMY